MNSVTWKEPSILVRVRNSSSWCFLEEPFASQSMAQNKMPNHCTAKYPLQRPHLLTLTPVILTGRLGTKIPVNTKWPWHLSIFPWIPGSPVHTCMCSKSCPRVPLQTFQKDSTWLNRLRGKQWWVIQRTSKFVTVTLDSDEEWCMYLLHKRTAWREKLAVLSLPRFQGSLQRTKSLILNPGKRFMWIYRRTLRKRVS